MPYVYFIGRMPWLSCSFVPGCSFLGRWYGGGMAVVCGIGGIGGMWYEIKRYRRLNPMRDTWYEFEHYHHTFLQVNYYAINNR